MEDFASKITELVQAEYKFVMRYRELLIAGFIAEFGCLPSECELVETRIPGEVGYTTTVTIRKQAT